MVPRWTTPYEREVLYISAERRNCHPPQMRRDFSQSCFNDSHPVSYLFVGIGDVLENEWLVMRFTDGRDS